MSLSLREQLLKAGLVSEQQVQRVERDQRQQAFVAPRGRRKPTGPSPQELAAQKAAAAKAARDTELNRKKVEKAERRARFAAVKQLVVAHQVARVETDDFYNFQDGSNIRRIEVTPELRARLVGGALAIVRCEGRYAFVPASVGEQVRGLVERALIHLHQSATATDANDPYQDHPIPDDLTW
jgi:uncharacterized protein YaiL (DUF2058 family)